MAKWRVVWAVGPLIAMVMCAIPPAASAGTASGKQAFTKAQVLVFDDDVIHGYNDLFQRAPTQRELRTWVALGEQFCVALDSGKNGNTLIEPAAIRSIGRRYSILGGELRAYPVLYSGSMVEAVSDLCPTNKAKMGLASSSVPTTAAPAGGSSGSATYTTAEIVAFDHDVVQLFKVDHTKPSDQQLRNWVVLGEQFCSEVDHGKNVKTLVNVGSIAIARENHISKKNLRGFIDLYTAMMVFAATDLCPANGPKIQQQLGLGAGS